MIPGLGPVTYAYGPGVGVESTYLSGTEDAYAPASNGSATAAYYPLDMTVDGTPDLASAADAAAAPEPVTGTLVAIGAVGLLALRRRYIG